MIGLNRRTLGLGLIGALATASEGAGAALGVAEEGYVPIGGLDQWITIHGDNARNPVILMVHGGPADVIWPYRDRLAGWEKAFTIVEWDQRGAGRTFGRYGRQTPDVTLETIAADGVAVAEHLRTRLKKRRVILLGHSWGTIVAARMLQLRPDLFAAYVGTGQVSSWKDSVQTQFDYLLAGARARGDAKTAAELEAIGHPDPANISQYFGFTRGLRAVMPEPDRVWLQGLKARILATPGVTDKDVSDMSAGMNFSGGGLIKAMVATDLPATAAKQAVPCFLIQGRDDITAPTAPAVAYFARLKAPRKDVVLIDGAAHFAFLTSPDAFLAALTAKVRPVAVARGG